MGEEAAPACVAPSGVVSACATIEGLAVLCVWASELGAVDEWTPLSVADVAGDARLEASGVMEALPPTLAGVSATVMYAAFALLAFVAVVLPESPAVARPPVMMPMPPPTSVATVPSACSVRFDRLALAMLERLVTLSASRSFARRLTIMESLTVVMTSGQDSAVPPVLRPALAIAFIGFVVSTPRMTIPV